MPKSHSEVLLLHRTMPNFAAIPSPIGVRVVSLQKLSMTDGAFIVHLRAVLSLSFFSVALAGVSIPAWRFPPPNSRAQKLCL
jgi:hypothetical protein